MDLLKRLDSQIESATNIDVLIDLEKSVPYVSQQLEEGNQQILTILDGYNTIDSKIKQSLDNQQQKPDPLAISMNQNNFQDEIQKLQTKLQNVKDKNQSLTDENQRIDQNISELQTQIAQQQKQLGVQEIIYSEALKQTREMIEKRTKMQLEGPAIHQIESQNKTNVEMIE